MADLKRIAFDIVKKNTARYSGADMKSQRFLAGRDFSYRDYLVNLNYKTDRKGIRLAGYIRNGLSGLME